ncbi:ankyrin repeat domain-containing protein [Rickettsia helvetica]
MLYLATLHDKSEIVKSHPDINVNEKNKCGYTSLHSASSNDKPEIVKMLLSHQDINVNEKDQLNLAKIIGLDINQNLTDSFKTTEMSILGIETVENPEL